MLEGSGDSPGQPAAEAGMNERTFRQPVSEPESLGTGDFLARYANDVS